MYLLGFCGEFLVFLVSFFIKYLVDVYIITPIPICADRCSWINCVWKTGLSLLYKVYIRSPTHLVHAVILRWLGMRGWFRSAYLIRYNKHSSQLFFPVFCKHVHYISRIELVHRVQNSQLDQLYWGSRTASVIQSSYRTLYVTDFLMRIELDITNVLFLLNFNSKIVSYLVSRTDWKVVERKHWCHR